MSNDDNQPALRRLPAWHPMMASLLINPVPKPYRVQLTPAPKVDPEKQRRFDWHPEYGYDRPESATE